MQWLFKETFPTCPFLGQYLISDTWLRHWVPEWLTLSDYCENLWKVFLAMLYSLENMVSRSWSFYDFMTSMSSLRQCPGDVGWASVVVINRSKNCGFCMRDITIVKGDVKPTDDWGHYPESCCIHFLKIILNQNHQVCLKQLHLLCGEPPLLSFVGDIEINFRATKSSTQSISENQWQFQEPKLEIPTGTI